MPLDAEDKPPAMPELAKLYPLRRPAARAAAGRSSTWWTT